MKIYKNNLKILKIIICFSILIIVVLYIISRYYFKDNIKEINKYFIKKKVIVFQNDIDSLIKELYFPDSPNFIIKNGEEKDYINYKKLKNDYVTKIFKAFNLIAINNQSIDEECKFISFVIYPYLDLLFLDGYQYGFYYTEEDVPINIFKGEKLNGTEIIYEIIDFSNLYSLYKTEKIANNLWFFETRDLTRKEIVLMN